MKIPIQLCVVPFVLLVQLCGANPTLCGRGDPPDYSGLGLRISEKKCLEYNFERQKLNKCQIHSDDSDNTEYPFMGVIATNEYNHTLNASKYYTACNAVLISPKFALTTAQCFNPITRNNGEFLGVPQIFVLGKKNIRDLDSIVVNIVRRLFHPNYYFNKAVYDIGLVELELELPLSKSVQPACLWTENHVDTNPKHLPTWGVTSIGEGGEYDKLKIKEVKPIDSVSCRKKISAFTPGLRMIPHQYLCVEDTSDIQCDDVGMKVNLGYVGAPVIEHKELYGHVKDNMPHVIGLRARTFDCNTNTNITIFLRVSSCLDWIEQTVWPSETV